MDLLHGSHNGGYKQSGLNHWKNESLCLERVTMILVPRQLHVWGHHVSASSSFSCSSTSSHTHRLRKKRRLSATSDDESDKPLGLKTTFETFSSVSG